MKKKILLFILLVIIVIGGYLAFDKFILGEKDPDFIGAINTSPNSTVAMVVKAPNGEAMTVFKRSAGDIGLDKIVLQNRDGKQGLIQLDSYGLPKTYEFNGNTVSFSNYTEETVDITVKKADGSIEVLEAESLNLPKPKSSLVETVVSKVSAQSGLRAEDIPSYAYTKPSTSDDEKIHDYILSTPGTAVNVISCGVGLGSILFSGGATSPFAYLGCAALFTRMVTVDTEIGPCQGDVLDCAKDKVLETFNEKRIVVGKVLDENTGTALRGVSVKLSNNAGKTLAIFNTGYSGGYALPEFTDGAYKITISGSAIETKELRVAVSNDRIKMVDETDGSTVFNAKLGDFAARANFYVKSKSIFDGTWTGVGVATIEEDEEGSCGSESFTLKVENGKVTGSVDGAEDYPISVTGFVDGNGNITGSVKGAKFLTLGTYEGQLYSKSGSGTWRSPIFRCSGTLDMKRQ